MSWRLDWIFPRNISAEMFLHTKADISEAWSPAFCCPGKDSGKRRTGEVVWEETAAFIQRTPPPLPLWGGGHPPAEERVLAIPLKHLPLAYPQFSNKNTQERKMSSWWSELAFVSPPVHNFTSPVSHVRNLYQQRNESHEKVQGMAGTSGPHTVHATVS